MLGSWDSLPALQGVSKPDHTGYENINASLIYYFNLDTPGILWKFIVGSIIMILGLPIFGVTGASLYSKLLPPSIQGIYHRIPI